MQLKLYFDYDSNPILNNHPDAPQPLSKSHSTDVDEVAHRHKPIVNTSPDIGSAPERDERPSVGNSVSPDDVPMELDPRVENPDTDGTVAMELSVNEETTVGIADNDPCGETPAVDGASATELRVNEEVTSGIEDNEPSGSAAPGKDLAPEPCKTAVKRPQVRKPVDEVEEPPLQKRARNKPVRYEDSFRPAPKPQVSILLLISESSPFHPNTLRSNAKAPKVQKVPKGKVSK
jgi:hypothetical protein